MGHAQCLLTPVPTHPKHIPSRAHTRTHPFPSTHPPFPRTSPHVLKNIPACSQEHPHLCSRTSPPVPKHIPTCSQEHPRMFSRTSPHVLKNIPACSQEHPHLFPRTSPHVLKNIPACSQEHPHLFSKAGPRGRGFLPSVSMVLVYRRSGHAIWSPGSPCTQPAAAPTYDKVGKPRSTTTGESTWETTYLGAMQS